MKKTISLQPFLRPHMVALIDFLEGFLPKFEDKVEVVFGWAWAMNFYNWKERTMPIATLKGEVQSAERQAFGRLGRDDLYVRVKLHDLEIHFCHEGDLHVSFEVVTPLTGRILEYLFNSYSTISVEKQSEASPIFAFGLPIFLCTVALTNEAEFTKSIKLMPWDKTLFLEAGEEVRITGYSQTPGLLKILQESSGYTAEGWSDCDVRVTKDLETVFDSAPR